MSQETDNTAIDRKAERITDPLPYRDALTQAIEDCIHFYNNGRFQKRLRCMTPMEFHYAYAA